MILCTLTGARNSSLKVLVDPSNSPWYPEGQREVNFAWLRKKPDYIVRITGVRELVPFEKKPSKKKKKKKKKLRRRDRREKEGRAKKGNGISFYSYPPLLRLCAAENSHYRLRILFSPLFLHPFPLARLFSSFFVRTEADLFYDLVITGQLSEMDACLEYLLDAGR